MRQCQLRHTDAAARAARGPEVAVTNRIGNGRADEYSRKEMSHHEGSAGAGSGPSSAKLQEPQRCRECGAEAPTRRSLRRGLCRACRERRVRAREAEQARQAIHTLLGRDDVVILDTETTGMGDAEVIELSLIDTRGTVLLDTLVRPRRKQMSPFAQRIHGIHLNMLEDAPSWPEVLPQLLRLTDRATVLAWNADFDARMLEQTSAAWGLSHPRILFVCAMKLYGQLRRGKSRGLHKALRQEGLDYLLERYRSHRALADVRFVLEVLRVVVDPVENELVDVENVPRNGSRE